MKRDADFRLSLPNDSDEPIQVVGPAKVWGNGREIAQINEGETAVFKMVDVPGGWFSRGRREWRRCS